MSRDPLMTELRDVRQANDLLRHELRRIKEQRDQARKRCRRLFEALEWLYRFWREANGHPSPKIDDLLDELRPHVAKDQP